jgi:thymidylate synthase (FAD)
MIEVTYVDHMGSDLTVVNAARVSFGKETEWEIEESDIDGISYSFKKHLKTKDMKLIRYLANHKHTSPFGHAFASFHVKAPVFVARQLVKHKFLRWNEISRRYVDDEPELYEPDVWRGRSADKKQGSDGIVEGVTVKEYNKICINYYQRMIIAGIAPEQARMVLPQSMMTEWYWSGSLDAFADMCHLRCKPDTQAETREVALHVSGIMSEFFPVSWQALLEYAE